MTGAEEFDVSEAISLHLKRYPGNNDQEFDQYYGRSSNDARINVRMFLSEAMKVEPDWNRMSLSRAGDYVETVMRKRHPELSQKALEAIANYYTFLMR